MLKIDQKVEQGAAGVLITVIRLSGSADIHTEQDLEKTLYAIAATEPSHVVIDLSGVDILTSLALGALVGFRTRVMAYGGRVSLARVPELIAKTMRFTRVSELFVRYGTVDEAKAGVVKA